MSGDVLEFGKRKGRIEFGVFEIGASHFETIFDGVTENETTDDSSGGDGVSGKMSENVNAVGGNVFSDALIREFGGRNLDELAGVER